MQHQALSANDLVEQVSQAIINPAEKDPSKIASSVAELLAKQTPDAKSANEALDKAFSRCKTMIIERLQSKVSNPAEIAKEAASLSAQVDFPRIRTCIHLAFTAKQTEEVSKATGNIYLATLQTLVSEWNLNGVEFKETANGEIRISSKSEANVGKLKLLLSKNLHDANNLVELPDISNTSDDFEFSIEKAFLTKIITKSLMSALYERSNNTYVLSAEDKTEIANPAAIRILITKITNSLNPKATSFPSTSIVTLLNLAGDVCKQHFPLVKRINTIQAPTHRRRGDLHVGIAITAADLPAFLKQSGIIKRWIDRTENLAASIERAATTLSGQTKGSSMMSAADAKSLAEFKAPKESDIETLQKIKEQKEEKEKAQNTAKCLAFLLQVDYGREFRTIEEETIQRVLLGEAVSLGMELWTSVDPKDITPMANNLETLEQCKARLKVEGEARQYRNDRKENNKADEVFQNLYKKVFKDDGVIDEKQTRVIPLPVQRLMDGENCYHETLCIIDWPLLLDRLEKIIKDLENNAIPYLSNELREKYKTSFSIEKLKSAIAYIKETQALNKKLDEQEEFDMVIVESPTVDSETTGQKNKLGLN